METKPDSKVRAARFDRSPFNQIHIEVCLPDGPKLNKELQLVKIIHFVADLPAMLRAARLHCLQIFPTLMYSPVRMKYLCSISVDFAAENKVQLSEEDVEKISCCLMKHWQSSINIPHHPETE